MKNKKVLDFIKAVLKNMPKDWLNLTTHRLDIYNEKLAKTEFLTIFDDLFEAHNSESSALYNLPTAYDYIRLGHPLSSILEWIIAKLQGIKPAHVISFSSKTTPILAVLRKNLLSGKKTLIVHTEDLPESFHLETLRKVYGYSFEVKKIKNINEVTHFEGSVLFITENEVIPDVSNYPMIDFTLKLYSALGSVLLINNTLNEHYISDIQHVRRRETIAITPANAYAALKLVTSLEVEYTDTISEDTAKLHQKIVRETLHKITKTNSTPLVASSGLSMQYAIVMGLIDNALQQHPEKEIQIIVPTNCYGGTNDQARRIAACIKNVSIVDLAVDGAHDMVSGIDTVLNEAAHKNAIPFIIAEIPTNPRVEVPNLENLRDVLTKKRTTVNGTTALAPVFILDQTFCPNIPFLGDAKILGTLNTIAYVSGSKFPSGGKCTAGYCVANTKSANLLPFIEKHLKLCDNEATKLQMELLAAQLPSMNKRIADAYTNTREFVNYIQQTLPTAKINFVSEELALQGFTPSVFSLDLPTKGATAEERETYKRALNHQLINLMITEIPNESKYCVSYGQLQGCYWTIPATSTQGTTKEGDKDYIARVAVSHNMNLELHKKVFLQFVNTL